MYGKLFEEGNTLYFDILRLNLYWPSIEEATAFLKKGKSGIYMTGTESQCNWNTTTSNHRCHHFIPWRPSTSQKHLERIHNPTFRNHGIPSTTGGPMLYMPLDREQQNQHFVLTLHLMCACSFDDFYPDSMYLGAIYPTAMHRFVFEVVDFPIPLPHLKQQQQHTHRTNSLTKHWMSFIQLSKHIPSFIWSVFVSATINLSSILWYFT